MRELTDYSLVVLSDYEQSLFDRFKNENSVKLTRSDFKTLRKKGLIQGSIDGKSDWFDGLPESGTCIISPFGKGLRAYQKQQHRKERTNLVRHWVPVIISSTLSLAAIAISIIALLGQLGILQLTQPK